MTQTIAAHFDGRVIVPDGPVELPTGLPLRIRVELADNPEPRFAALLGFAADLPDAPPDLAAQHDHYLTGTPKR
ncbi:hypothetical protein [Urbifossiella limnaea]|uniref:DUF104 domain-containing protein n=1 Tax=Urbifossiella limnaea TaxID=2528023 RepID=A0A517XVT1_9BACT|nr:hypothetical protein [Urbifossiella limnaea]QDU21625.1 hypothetical protein ETAA1_35960 [Urbifossiella limnaea]